LGIHPVWKQDVCCPFVSILKIDHAIWSVCWSVTHVFALHLFQLLKDPYFEWAYLCHFSFFQCDLSGYGCTQSWFKKSIGRVRRVKHWIVVILLWALKCSVTGLATLSGIEIGTAMMIITLILVWFCLMLCQSSWFFDTRTCTSLLLLVCNLELSQKLYLNHLVGVFVVQF